jgi:hypothetical protein
MENKYRDDPRWLAAVERINDLVLAFPKQDFDFFLEHEPEFAAGFGRDFEVLPTSQVIYLQKLIEEAAVQLEPERPRTEETKED